MRLPEAAGPALLIALWGLVLALHQPGLGAAQSIVLSDGHADAFQPKLEDGRLVLYFHDDTASKLGSVDPADVLMAVAPEAMETVPDDEQYRFLGSPGDPVWIMPQDQKAGVLWPGVSTESLDGEWEGRRIELRLVSVSAPPGGSFHIFSIRSLVGVHHIWRTDALPSSYEVGIGVHAHMNWAFTQPGRYVLGVQACGTHTGPGVALGQICSDVTPYTIDVQSGEPPPTATAPAATSTPSPAGTEAPPGETAPAAVEPVGTPRARQGVVIEVRIRPPSTGDAGLADPLSPFGISPLG